MSIIINVSVDVVNHLEANIHQTTVFMLKNSDFALIFGGLRLSKAGKVIVEPIKFN